MKLHIHMQQLRLRIDEEELGRLRRGEALSSETHLPGQAGVFRWSLRLDEQASMVVDHGGWRFVLPEASIDDYVKQLPSRKGLDFIFGTEAGTDIALSFEVDVRDSARRRGVTSHRPQREPVN
jgi:hypothetical protein